MFNLSDSLNHWPIWKILLSTLDFTPRQEPSHTRYCLHILHHYVLVRDKAINPIVPSFPPVFRCSMIEQKGSSFLEREFSCRSSNIVKLGNSFYGLALWVGRTTIIRFCIAHFGLINPILHFLSAHFDRDQLKEGRLQVVVTMCPLQRNIINLCPRFETSGLLQELQETAAYSNVTAAFGREASASCWKGSYTAGEWDGGQAIKISENKMNKLRWIIKGPRNQDGKGK